MESEAYRHHRYNFRLGVLNGTMFVFGVSFMHPVTIIPNFVLQFTDSKVLVGLSSVLHVGGWCLPQILAAGYVESLRRKKPLYVIGNSVRLLLTALALVSIFYFYASRPLLGLGLFMAIYGVAHLCGGVAGLAYMEMAGAMIPPHRRGAYFSYRFLFGGSILTVLAGFIIKEVLKDQERFPFPFNYELLFGLGWLMMAVGVGLFCLTRETPAEVLPEQRSFRSRLYELPGLLRSDSRLSRIVVNRLFGTFSRMSWPFFIVFALEDVGLKVEVVGTFLIVQTVGGFMGNIMWGKVSTLRGNRAVVRLSSAFEIAVPLYAALIGAWLMKYGKDLDPTGLSLALMPIFFILGAGVHGAHIGTMSFVLDIAPVERRPTYIGIVNTTMGFATIPSLLIGGLIAELIGFLWVFILSALCALGGFVQAAALPEDGSL